MKRLHNLIGILLCVVLLAVPLRAFAEEEQDATEQSTEQKTEATTTTTTTEPETTVFVVPTHPVITTTSPSVVTEAPLSFEPPIVRITREDLVTTPKPKDEFTMTVVFHNYSNNVTLKTGLVTFEPSEGLTMEENSASMVVPALGPDDVRYVRIKLHVAEKAQTANQSVTAVYNYSYKSPEGLQQVEYTEKLLLTIVPASDKSESTAIVSATPNIIVTGYDYGGTIAAGDTFTLRLQFQNTSKKLTAENIVMSVDAGTGLSITAASNTYYYASLGAGKTQSQTIPMRVLANADPEGAKIDINFKYQYVDGSTRSDASASERLSVPIYIPDRFTISPPEMDLIGTQNEELSLSLPYNNKSRVGVSNVTAELLFDDAAVFCEQPRVNLGNIESGKSGSIDFFFTPLEAGNGSVTVKITYEDELMQEKEREIPVTYSAEESMMDAGFDEPMEDMPEEASSGLSWVKIAIIAGAVLVVVLIVVLIVRKRKKKKAAEPAIDFDWGSPQEVKTHEDP